MHNFRINNSIETLEIDILGTIGEDWLSEGITMQGIRNQIADFTSGQIVLNISSLGGDVNHALTIHDMLKSHPARVTARIMGATASAGTIVALAADEVQMSENSLFLVHNAWTMTLGNAEELRKTANDLDRFDDRIVNIYKKKTGRRDNTIRKLMAEERWIDADEALEWGFIDKVYRPTAAAASMVRDQFEQIRADGRLPEIPEKINQINEEMTEETKTWMSERFDEIKALFSPKEDPPAVVTEEEVNARIEEIQLRMKEVEVSNAEALAEKVAQIETLTTERHELQERVNALQGELDVVTEKYNKMTAPEVTPEAGEDPDPQGTPKKMKYEKEVAAVADYIKTFKPKN